MDVTCGAVLSSQLFREVIKNKHYKVRGIDRRGKDMRRKERRGKER